MTPLDLTRVCGERLVLSGRTAADGGAHRCQGDPEVRRYLPHEPWNRDTVAAKTADWSGHRRLAADRDFLGLAV